MIIELEHRIWKFVYTVSPSLHAALFKRRRFVKYLISGGTAAAVNIGLLYVFTDIFGIWYITSAVMSFVAAFFVSFIFQKFWTFEDRSTDNMHGQAAVYLVVTTTNLCLNTALIYGFVEFIHIHYLFAQIIAGGIIACESFFVYRKFIFRTIPPASL